MISESAFTAIFGAVSSVDEDSLVHLARAAVREGFAIVPCYPGTKKPICTLTAVEVKRADAEAQEAARAAGKKHWAKVRHACSTKHAITDAKVSDRVIKRLMKNHGRINLGIEVHRSRIVVVDVDTPEEVQAFRTSWEAENPGEPFPDNFTVSSPGVLDGETWVHRGGGHYYFTLPENVTLPPTPGGLKVVLDPDRPQYSWSVSWADRQVLVPPSERPEGRYQLTGEPRGIPLFLARKIYDHVIAYRERKESQERALALRVESGAGEASVDTWSAALGWNELLEPEGWTETGDSSACGCPEWTAPGDHANPKSATAHEPGCALYDDSPGHAPIHIWTDNPPAPLQPHGTYTKLQFVALTTHGSIDGAAIAATCRDLGIAREGSALPPLNPLAKVLLDQRRMPRQHENTNPGNIGNTAGQIGNTGTLSPAPDTASSLGPSSPVNPSAAESGSPEWDSVASAAAPATALTPISVPGPPSTPGPPDQVPPPIGPAPLTDAGAEHIEYEVRSLDAKLEAREIHEHVNGDRLLQLEKRLQARRLEAVKLAKADAQRDEELEPGASWIPLDLSDVVSGSRIRLEPSVGLARADGLRLLYPGKEHVVMGEMESGKSWFSCGSAAAELAAGGTVVYFHFEESDAEGTVDKLLALGATPESIVERFRFIAPGEAVTPEWLRPLTELKPALVVLDGVNEAMSLHGLGIREEDGAAAYRRLLVKPFTRAGATVLSCDHVVKNADNRGRYALGSVHKGNGLDGSSILLENSEPFGRGKRGVTKVFVTKDRPGFLRAHGDAESDTPGKTYLGNLVLDATDRPLLSSFVPDHGPRLSFEPPRPRPEGAGDLENPELRAALPSDLPHGEWAQKVAAYFLQLYRDNPRAGASRSEVRTHFATLASGRTPAEEKAATKNARVNSVRAFDSLAGGDWLVPSQDNRSEAQDGKMRWRNELEDGPRPGSFARPGASPDTASPTPEK